MVSFAVFLKLKPFTLVDILLSSSLSASFMPLEYLSSKDPPTDLQLSRQKMMKLVPLTHFLISHAPPLYMLLKFLQAHSCAHTNTHTVLSLWAIPSTQSGLSVLFFLLWCQISHRYIYLKAAFLFSSGRPTGGLLDRFVAKVTLCNGLIALQWSRQMLQFTVKVSPIHHLVPTALNHRKQPLISGQWAESLHFWSLLSTGRKWLILLVPGLLWVLQRLDFIIRGLWRNTPFHTSCENTVV